MNYLLDTCVVSEFKKKRPQRSVINWLDNQLDGSLFLSVLTIGEIEKGIRRLPDTDQKNDLENFLENIIFRFDRHIIYLDLVVIKRWAALTAELEKKGKPMTIIDSFIAATALAHDLTIITRNESDFISADVQLLNIWK